MTDRHSGYIVVLDNNIREDAAQATLAAIAQIKGVLTVTPQVADAASMIAEARAENAVKERIINAIWPRKEVL